MNTETNPLLELAEPGVTNRLPRFADIRPEHVEPAIDRVLTENRAAIERLTAEVTEATWDNFAEPLEDLNERLGRMWSPVGHLNAVMNSEALRAAYNACLPKLTDYWTELGQDARLYKGFRQIHDSPAFSTLNAPRRKIVENALRDFRLAGVDLPEAPKRRFREIQQELALLYSKIDENVLDATNAWELHVEDPAQLAGLPERAREQARATAEAAGRDGWIFNLHAPSFHPFMRYAEDRELRRQMYEAYVTRASELGPQAGRFDNGELINQILNLRAEAARLVGFSDYAGYSLATKMVREPSEVLAFLRDLAARSHPAAERDLAELQGFARERGQSELEAWDIPFWSERLRESRYDYREEDLRPYFPVPRVLEGMFEIVRRLYGLRIRAVDTPGLWHPDARFYEIYGADGELRGHFYLDLYARANKRGGAWMDDCRSRKRRGRALQTPVAYLTCNFSAPLGTDPALLTHGEVVTLFHEFGHGLHHLLTRVDDVGVAGINGVAWDAVELPSQFMENWCWEREALDLIAGHYRSGNRIPDELFRKLTAARNFQSGMQFVRQLEFALFDMRLHSDFEPGGRQSVQEVLDEVRREVAVIHPPAFNRFQHSFTHVFAGSGYAAGYYSYKWAEVLSADAFSRFEETGIFDAATGRAFLENILEPGGSVEPLELFVRFRGREPKIDALLRHSGLAA